MSNNINTYLNQIYYHFCIILIQALIRQFYLIFHQTMKFGNLFNVIFSALLNSVILVLFHLDFLYFLYNFELLINHYAEYFHKFNQPFS